MSLNPRAIATLGIGYGPRPMAMLGLWPVDGVIEPETRPAGGGGRGLPRRDAKPARRDDDELLIMVLL